MCVCVCVCVCVCYESLVNYDNTMKKVADVEESLFAFKIDNSPRKMIVPTELQVYALR